MKGVAWADADPLAGTKVLAGFGSVHQQAVEVQADNAYSRLSDVNNVVGRRVDDIFRSVLWSALRAPSSVTNHAPDGEAHTRGSG
jgi:hypothetical protein